MIDIDKWQEIYFTVRRHKTRTALTAFGVFWGIFMLVVLLGAANGLERGVTKDFGDVTNVVYIWVSNSTQLPYKGLSKGRQIKYTDEDVNAILNRIPEVSFAEGVNTAGGWRDAQYVVHNDNSSAFTIRGTHPTMAAMNSVVVVEGRYINQRDIGEKRKIAVIGSGAKKVLFEPDENPVGQEITINNLHFQIAGVFEPRATGDNARRDSELIFIPNSTLRYTFNQIDHVGSLVLRPKPGIHAQVVEDKAKKLLMERHKINPKDVGVVSSFNVQKEYDKVQALFTGITLFSWLVAIGTIMAGAIGVGNIMLIVVKERTREIGLRRALGATPLSIVAMIVEESVVVTAVAGYFGLVTGVLLLETVSAALEKFGMNGGMFDRPEIDFATALLAMFILVISGLLASLLPAGKAAAVDPILALQDE